MHIPRGSTLPAFTAGSRTHLVHERSVPMVDSTLAVHVGSLSVVALRIPYTLGQHFGLNELLHVSVIKRGIERVNAVT